MTMCFFTFGRRWNQEPDGCGVGPDYEALLLPSGNGEMEKTLECLLEKRDAGVSTTNIEPRWRSNRELSYTPSESTALTALCTGVLSVFAHQEVVRMGTLAHCPLIPPPLA